MKISTVSPVNVTSNWKVVPVEEASKKKRTLWCNV